MYTGYVIPDSGTNPVQVWVPDIDGWFSIGSTRTVGYNMLNAIGAIELIEMRAKCGYYYLTQELNSGNYKYDATMGAGTTEEHMPKEREGKIFPDMTKAGEYVYKYNGRANQRSFSLAQSNPMRWMSSTFSFDRDRGTVPNAGANYPTGEFVKMSRWQKVIVSRIDGGSTGIVVRVLPWADDYNFVLKSQTEGQGVD